MSDQFAGDFQRYVLGRIVSVIWTSIAAVTIIFFTFRFLPGDPFALDALGSEVGQEAVIQLREQFGLDEPLHIQYAEYLMNVFTGNFGISYRYRTPVTGVIFDKMINSLLLLVPAIVLTFVLGAVLGTLYGWYRDSLGEKAALVFHLFVRSTPVFILGIILLKVFSYELGWFPASGMRSVTANWDGILELVLSVDFLYHYTLPFTAVFLYYLADPALITRSGVMEVRSEDFMELHRAKGLRKRVQMKHAARNSLLPLLTYLGVRLGLVFQGQVLIEVVFGWPGIGRELVNSILRQDYPVVQGIVIIMAFSVIFLNFLIDITYAYIDPTIEHG